MALTAENDVGRTEHLYELGRDVSKRFGNHSQIRFDLLQRRANLARTRADAFDGVVDEKQHSPISTYLLGASHKFSDTRPDAQCHSEIESAQNGFRPDHRPC